MSARNRSRDSEPYEAGRSLDERLAEARRVKAMSVRDVTDDISYFSRKRIQNDVAKERERNKMKEKMAREKKEREFLGYSVWKEKQEQELREKREAEKFEKDHRTESELRQQLREFRRQDRAHARQRQNEYNAMDRERERKEIARERERYEDEKRDREIRWARQERKRDQLNLMRQKLNEDRKKREEQRYIDKQLLEKRQQMEEERNTNANSDWAIIYERKDREYQRKLVQATKAERKYRALGLEKTGDEHDIELDATFRDALRRKRRLDNLGKSLRESEEEMNETKRWYHNRALDRTERHYRTLKSIKS